ncbi:Carbonic anhydrase [Desmophyllum pertusum]|uniref:Carbonic anhydrase n=1 Tax=Desmophyllum pertusum TaxID=174260 RepID=A0A9W9Z1H7_9CNID|nr:Carbonic anhydrase [Desmophyllum pertusum]
MESKIGIVLLAVISIVYAGEEGSRWGYKQTVYGPTDWGLAAPLCTGQFQSPIDIITSSAQTNSSHNGLALTFDNTDGAISGSLTNNGHAPTVTLDKTKGGVTLAGGPLGQTTFSLEQFHFHFGCESNVGSEHTVDGNSYASEMHLVFYNTLYESFQEAASKSDGLSVIGVFLQVNGGFNEWLENIALSLTNVKFPSGGSYSPGGSIPLATLVPDLVSKNAPYYTYKGSLTTPPCYESVQWIVLKNPISVTKSQLEIMRSLSATSGNSLCNNFRPVNALNGRKLYKWPGNGKLPGLLSVPFYN